MNLKPDSTIKVKEGVYLTRTSLEHDLLILGVAGKGNTAFRGVDFDIVLAEAQKAEPDYSNYLTVCPPAKELFVVETEDQLIGPFDTKDEAMTWIIDAFDFEQTYKIRTLYDEKRV